MINQCFFGDCRDTMRDLIAKGVKVNCIVTSPPYWGLRDYGIPPSVWGGDQRCEHDWTAERCYTKKTAGKASADAFHEAGEDNAARLKEERWREYSKCSKCNAWLGCLGLEPDFRMFITHMVEVFDLARELLTDDGVAFVNMGDSYAAASMAGLKLKDLCLIPDRLGIALQDAGWWVRSKLPWIKRNGMPESTTDRPAQSVEYVFMLTKRARYFYDHTAVKVKSSPATHELQSHANLENQTGSMRANGGAKTNGNMKAVGHVPGNKTHKGTTAYENGEERMRTKAGVVVYAEKMRTLAESGSGVKNNDSMDEALAVMPSARNFRVTDLFFQSWQGLWSDEEGEPLALIVNTRGFKGAHFATFPPKLIEPLILAATSAHGHCPKCGAGWTRVTEKGQPNLEHQQACGGNVDGEYHGEAVKDYAGTGAQDASEVKARILDGMRETVTTGWEQSCKCQAAPVPAVVFDPFFGSGTTGQVSQALGRNWLGCDMNESYGKLQEERTRQGGLPL